MDAHPSARGFPLFPLPIVALPGEGVPLHVFEDRYRRLVEHCLLAEPGSPGREFGIVWLSEDELKPVGCACELESVLERMPDGRLNILGRGTRPFRLLERQDDLPYPAGGRESVEPRQAAQERYAELLEQATDERPAAEELSRMDAYAMAATVQFG